MRDKKNQIDEDIKNLCYICNIGRYPVIFGLILFNIAKVRKNWKRI